MTEAGGVMGSFDLDGVGVFLRILFEKKPNPRSLEVELSVEMDWRLLSDFGFFSLSFILASCSFLNILSPISSRLGSVQITSNMAATRDWTSIQYFWRSYYEMRYRDMVVTWWITTCKIPVGLQRIPSNGEPSRLEVNS